MTHHFRFLIPCLWAALATLNAHAAPSETPVELVPLIPAHTELYFHDYADLNGDGRKDALLVVESSTGKEDDVGQRTLLIAIRQADGKLKIVKRNDKVVYCRSCGGTMGDPLAGIEVKARTITVEHYGGSGWRWGNSISFAYSRRDDTWQLVRVEEYSFHFSQPDNVKSRSYEPPRDFGKIDIADFDPDKFKGVGPK